jgi:CRISPR-associated protein Cas2
MGLMVIVTENAPPSLRGKLTIWLLEIRARVYIGNYSIKVREMIWKHVLLNLGKGNAVMAWHVPNDAGFDFMTTGRNQRLPREMDGIKLISYMPEEKQKS